MDEASAPPELLDLTTAIVVAYAGGEFLTFTGSHYVNYEVFAGQLDRVTTAQLGDFCDSYRTSQHVDTAARSLLVLAVSRSIIDQNLHRCRRSSRKRVRGVNRLQIVDALINRQPLPAEALAVRDQIAQIKARYPKPTQESK